MSGAEAARVAYAEAGDLIDDFAATLAPTRAARLLAAPAIAETLLLTGRVPSGGGEGRT